MFFVYIIKSLKNEKRYIGYTSKSISGRLYDHNHGSNNFTRNNGPFKLIYSEEFLEKTKAIKREKFLKTGQGRKFLDNLKM